MLREITLVMAYYDNPHMWVQQLKYMAGLPRDVRQSLKVVLVDDCSPNHPAQNIGIPDVDIRIFRVKEDVRWNQDAARNIGVKETLTEWVLLTDIDHVVSKELWMYLFTSPLNVDKAYRFARVSAPDMEPYKWHPNTWLMTTALFDHMGGYDERLAGYYGTDRDFQTRLEAVAQVDFIAKPIIRYGREVIADASTTGYTRKEPYDKPSIKRLVAEREAKGLPTQRGRFPYHRVA